MWCCREPLAYCRGIGIIMIKLYWIPVCFCGYFRPQWVVDHELKHFQGVWFRRKIPDYGTFYPRISCKMKFWWFIPSYNPLPTFFLFLFGTGGTVSSLLLDTEYLLHSLHFRFHFQNYIHFLKKHCHLLQFNFLLACVQFHIQTENACYNQPFLQLTGTGSHMSSRSIYNLKIDTIYMYDIQFDR